MHMKGSIMQLNARCKLRNLVQQSETLTLPVLIQFLGVDGRLSGQFAAV